MHVPLTKKEMFQCWVALLLTAGEFTAAIVLVIEHGHILAIYLAVTYLMRETSGGKHYHHIVVNLMERSKQYNRDLINRMFRRSNGG